MKTKLFLKATIIIATVSILTGCRTMQLNQDGKTLGKGMFESAAGVGTALTATFMGSPFIAPNINVEFQQRFGVAEKVELQLKVHNDLTGMYAPPYGQGFSLMNEINFGVKVNTYDKNGYAFSLLPFIGVSLGMTNNGFPLKGYFNLTGDVQNPLISFLNPNAGLALIGSKSGLRYNFYWGGTINVTPNITVCLNGLPSFDTDFTFNWGWEIPKDRIVYRHEIGLFSLLNWCITENHYDTGGSTLPKTYTPQMCVSIGLSYHFSAGVRYNPGQRQVRE